MSRPPRNKQAASFHQQPHALMEVLDRISDGFFAVDHDWRIIYINRTLEKWLSIRREDFLDRQLWSSYPTLNGTTYETRFRTAMQGSATVKFEQYSVPSRQWFEITASPSSTGLSVFIRNITERKATEEQLRKLSLVAMETEDAVVMLNADNRITWVNAAFTRMTGYRFDEAIGQLPSALLIGDREAPEALHLINEQQRKKEPVHTEILNYKKNGEPFWSEVSIQPLFDASGNLEQYFSIRRDITARKKLESELAAVQKKISAAVVNAQERERAEVGRELHDNVNQILTSVKLYQELLLAGVGNRVELLKKSIDMLAVSIDENRHLSKRLSAPTLGSIKLADSVRELVRTFETTRKFTFHLHLETVKELDVPEELHLAVYRILQEHLTNVSKHAAANNVEVRLERVENTLRLMATDDGRGFDPSKKSNGIGIGNMLMRVEHLNGEFSINSAPGKGCELNVSFPLAAV
jgi:PAS domain S-box-containing protein